VAPRALCPSAASAWIDGAAFFEQEVAVGVAGERDAQIAIGQQPVAQGAGEREGEVFFDMGIALRARIMAAVARIDDDQGAGLVSGAFDFGQGEAGLRRGERDFDGILPGEARRAQGPIHRDHGGKHGQRGQQDKGDKARTRAGWRIERRVEREWQGWAIHYGPFAMTARGFAQGARISA